MRTVGTLNAPPRSPSISRCGCAKSSRRWARAGSRRSEKRCNLLHGAQTREAGLSLELAAGLRRLEVLGHLCVSRARESQDGKDISRIAAHEHCICRFDRRPQKGTPNKLTAQLQATLAEAAQQYDGEALQTIVAVMRDKTETATLRVRCAEIILERAHGRTATVQNPTRDPDFVPLAERLKWYVRRDEIEKSAGKVVQLPPVTDQATAGRAGVCLESARPVELPSGAVPRATTVRRFLVVGAGVRLDVRHTGCWMPDPIGAVVRRHRRVPSLQQRGPSYRAFGW